MKTSIKNIFLFFPSVFIFYVLFFSNPVFSQTENDRERALEQQRTTLRQKDQEERKKTDEFIQKQRSRSATDPKLRRKQELLKRRPGEGRCKPVRKIIITGDKKLSLRKQKKLVGHYENRCFRVVDFDNVLRILSNYYIGRGYVTTRAYIPSQKKQGVLKIKVIPGIIEDISFEQKTWDNGKGELFTAFPFKKGKRLNLRDIEQGMDQINRLRKNEAKMVIYPGTKVGQSKISIENKKKKRWRITSFIANSGNPSTGQVTGTIGAEFDSIMTLNDFISITYSRSLVPERDRSFSQTVSYQLSFPIGYWNFSFLGSYFSYASRILGNTVDIQSEGTSHYWQLGVERVIYRNASNKTSLSTSISQRLVDNFLQGIHLSVSSRDSLVEKITLSHGTRLGRLGLNFSLGTEFSQLSPIINPEGEEETQNPEAPPLQSIKANFSLGASMPFTVWKQNFSYSVSASGIYADKILVPSQQIGIGGSASVRGFLRDSIGGDKGAFLRTELNWHLPQNIFPFKRKFFGSTTLFIAYDVGYVALNIEDFAPYVPLEGFAIGFRTGGGNVNLSFSASRAIRKPEHFEDEGFIFLFSIGASI